MNAEQIRTFLEVVATGNFTAAAERLHTTQSTVSARIKALEIELGQPVFIRGHNHAELSVVGQRLQRHATTIMRAWEQARQESSLPPGFQSIFRLGGPVSLWDRLILKWVPWMRRKAPKVALRLEGSYSESLADQLAEGQLDVGIMYLPRHRPGLRIEELTREDLMLVSGSSRVKPWAENYVFVDWGEEFRSAHAQAFPDMPPPALSVGLGALGLQYILEHKGAGYLPSRAVGPLLEEKRLFIVPGAPVFHRSIYVLYPANPTDADLLRLALGGLRSLANERNAGPTSSPKSR